MPASLPTNTTDPFTNDLREFLSPYSCCGFHPVCSLKRIHPRGKTVSKKLVCESKEVMHWQEQDDLCLAEIQHTGWQQTKLSSIWGGSSEQREGLWKSWDPEGWTPGFSMVLQFFRFPDPLSSEVICVCFPWHQPCSTCKVAKCCC